MSPGGIVVALLLLSSAAVAKSTMPAALAQIQNLAVALDTFRDDVGRYPTDAEGLRVLTEKVDTAIGWDGPYLKRPAPSDPWGQPYVYHSPARFGSGPYEIYSTGRNARDDQGRDDDITSWSGVPCGYGRGHDPVVRRFRFLAALAMVVPLAGFFAWQRSRRRMAALASLLAVVVSVLLGRTVPDVDLLLVITALVSLALLSIVAAWPAALARSGVRMAASVAATSIVAVPLVFWAWETWIRC